MLNRFGAGRRVDLPVEVVGASGRRRAAGTSRTSPAEASLAGRDAVDAHVAPGAARHRRRGRDERLRHRARPAAGRARHRGGGLHPGREQPAPTRPGDRPRGHRPACARRPVRGHRPRGAARLAVRLHGGRPAHRGRPRSGLVRRRPLALLAVRAGRAVGRPPVGRASGAHGPHPGAGQERLPRRRRPPRAGTARPGRAGDHQGGDAAHRVDRHRAPPPHPALRRGAGQGGRGRPRCRPRRLPPRRPPGRPRAGRPRPRHPAPPLRRTHPAAQGTGRPARRRGRTHPPRPRPPRTAGGRRRRRPERLRARTPGLSGQARRRTRHHRHRPFPAAGTPGAARPLVPRGDGGRRPQPQRELRPGRGRGPGLRHPRGGRLRRRPAHRRRPRDVRSPRPRLGARRLRRRPGTHPHRGTLAPAPVDRRPTARRELRLDSDREGRPRELPGGDLTSGRRRLTRPGEPVTADPLGGPATRAYPPSPSRLASPTAGSAGLGVTAPARLDRHHERGGPCA
ncbi:conserved hypothetical protein [Parafrankia sp. Ea1.12]|nr:conserved hypothetical protein [Parafrankia sp. Ea1.12]